MSPRISPIYGDGLWRVGIINFLFLLIMIDNLFENPFWENLIKTPSHCAISGILILMLLYGIYSFFIREKGVTYVCITICLLIGMGILECFVFFNSNPKPWMQNEIFLGVVVWMAVLVIVIFQFLKTFSVLSLLSMLSYDRLYTWHYVLGLAGVVYAFVAFLACYFFFPNYIVFVGYTLIIFETLVIIYNFYRAISRQGNVLAVFAAFFSAIVYILGFGGLLCLLFHFIIPIIDYNESSINGIVMDLTKTATHSFLTWSFLLMLVLIINTVTFNNKYIQGLFIIAIGFFECQGFVSGGYSNGDPNFYFGWGIIVLIAVFFMMVNQCEYVFDTLNRLCHGHSYMWGFKGALVAGYVAFILSLFNHRYPLRVAYVLAVFEFVIIVCSVYRTIKNGGSVLGAFFSIIVYLFGVGGLAFLFVHFVVPMLLFTIFVLGFLRGGTGSGEPSEVTLDNGTTIYHRSGRKWRDDSGNSWTQDDMRRDEFSQD